MTVDTQIWANATGKPFDKLMDANIQLYDSFLNKGVEATNKGLKKGLDKEPDQRLNS
jgi:hypothetical protein